MNKKGKFLFGVAISLFLVIYLFYKIDIKDVKNTVLQFNKNVFLILSVIYIVGMILRSFRWQLLLKQREQIEIIIVLKALVIGYMVNNLLPAKVGELARAEYLKREKNISRSFVLGTVFIERMCDLSMVMILFGFSLLFSKTSRDVFIHKQWIIYIILAVLTLSIYLMMKPKFFYWLIKYFPLRVKSKVEIIILSFTDAFRFINNKFVLTSVGLLSFIIWGLTLLSAYSILWGLGIILPFYAYLFIITAGVFGMVIPSTSGGIGVYHAVSTGALLLFSVAPEKALAFAIISHAFDFFPNIIAGFLVLILNKFQLSNN